MFKYKGFDYNLDQVTQAADGKGLSVDEYVNKFGLETVEDTVEIQTDPNEGKTNGAVETDAAVAPVPEQASESTELESVDISSESQPKRSVRGEQRKRELEKREAKQEQDLIFEEIEDLEIYDDTLDTVENDKKIRLQELARKQIESEYKANDVLEYKISPEEIDQKAQDILDEKNKPSLLKSYGAQTVRGFAGFAKGASQFEETLKYSLLETALDVFDPDYKGTVEDKQSIMQLIKSGGMTSPLGGSLGPSSNYEDFISKLEPSIREYEDITITEEIEKGNYLLAGERAVGAALESLPSIVAAATGYGGLAMLAGSVAGGKFQEEFEANPEKSTGALLANAVGTGVIEASFELVTRGILRKAKILKDSGAEKAAEDLILGGAGSLVKNLGLNSLKEGGSEAATKVTTLLFDKYGVFGLVGGLDKDIDWAKEAYNIVDEGIVGSIMGGGTTLAGSLANSDEAIVNRAQTILMPSESKNEMVAIANNMSKLFNDRDKANSPEGVRIIDEALANETQKMQDIREESNAALYNMTPAELKVYAGNQNQLSKLRQQIQDPKEIESVKKLANEKFKQIRGENSVLFDEAAERRIQRGVDVITKAAESLDGVTVKEFETTDQVKKFIQEQDPEADVKTSQQQGFVVQNPDTGEQTVVINKEVAGKEKAVNIAGHEFGHVVLFNTVKDNPETAINLGRSLLGELQRVDPDQIKSSKFKQRLQQYSTDPESIQMEEVLTLFSDALATGDVKFKENVFTRIGDQIRRTMQSLGFKTKFNNGRDVYNFIKDYNRTIEKGAVGKAQIAAAKEGVKGTLVEDAKQQTDEQIIKESRIYQEVETFKDDLVSEQSKDATAFLIADKLQNEIDRRLKIDVDAETREDIIRNFLFDDRRGLLGLLKNYSPARNESIMGYLNSTTPGGKLLDARLIEFYQDDPRYNQIIQSTTDENIQRKAERVTAEEKSVEETKEVRGPRKPTETTRFSDTALSNLGVKNKAEAEKQISDATNKAFEGQEVTMFGQTKNVPVTVAEIYGKMFGVNPETIYDKKRNYSKKDSEGLTRIKQYLIDNATSDFARLPRTKDDFGKATFIPNNVMNALYTDGELTGTLKDYLDIVREKPVKAIYRDRVGQTIRGLFNTSIRNRMVEDLIPSKPERVRAGVKFSKAKAKPKTGINAEIETIVGGRLPFTPEGNQQFRDFLTVELPKYLGKDVTKIIKPGDVAGAGNSAVGSRKTSGAIGRGFRFIGNRQRTQRFIPETDQALQSGEILDLEATREEIGQAVQLLSPEQVKDIAAATSSQTRASMKNNEANKDSIKRGRRLVLDALFKAVQADPKSIVPVRELLYNQNANTSFGRKFATVTSTETNLKPKENTWEEHVYQFGSWAKRTLQAFKTGDPNIVNNWLQWADDNYYQEVTGKPTQAVVDSVYEGWKAKSQEHPYLKQALDEAFKTGDFSKVPSSDIRKYNEFFTLNPNVRTRDGVTDAQRYNVEVPASLQNNKAVVNEQGKLIYQQLIGYITPQQAKQQIQEFSKLAPSILKASKSNNKKLPPGVKLEDPSTFDKFDMVDVLARQMFPKEANSNDVKSGKITAYEALDPDQQFEIMVKVPGTPVENTIAVMYISDNAIKFARNADAPSKGISVWDFDDTLATTKSNVLYTMPDGTEGVLNAEQFAKQGEELLQQGAEFDFSEFEKVTKGAKGPMFEKAVARNRKFGNNNVFILTARTQAAAEPIHQFLKAIGLDIPLKNIVGLGNSTPEAKARWVVGKASQGYNDFYFADDAYKNVKAVGDALSVLDVKSKVRQAYVKFSKASALDKGFNDILEQTKGIASEKEYKRVKAEVAGAARGKVFRGIPYSAQDFVGLLYETLSKGKLGDSQMAWYKEHLIKPFARAMNDIDNARLNTMQDYRDLKKQLGVVPKDLRKKVPGEPYTREQAVRVYIWNNQGTEVPGISKQDLKDLTEYVQNNAELQVFADQVIAIQKGEQYATPQEGWPTGSITTDILRSINTDVRSKYLKQWQDNVDVIFSEKNMNKLEAAYGKPYRKAMENTLQRMKTGRNRTFSDDTLSGRFTDWLQGSIGTIMFFNTRSALLQTISSINFINFTDNNPLAAAKAFGNQKQYWSDFMTLINSDFLKARRSGLRFNVTEADIANMAREGGPRAVINQLLQLGFAPTQIADSFAIASGGATFYRNRIKSLTKQGMSKAEAEAQAFEDFRENAEESQQSSRPDRISMQQAGPIGRLILAFANTPAQYARLTDKAIRDLKNNRGDAKTNISKIIYYTTVQNLIFNALQQALFAMAFDDEEPDDKEKKDKYIGIANGMADSLLRGAGFAGAAVSVGKNSIIRIINEMEKKQPKLEKVGYELTKISPPISAKLSRINQAARSYQWDKDKMVNGGWGLDNPAYLAAGNVISALTNIPLDRGVKKINNVVKATDSDLELWERLALFGGWQDWEIGIKEETKKNKPQPRKTRRTERRSKERKTTNR